MLIQVILYLILLIKHYTFLLLVHKQKEIYFW